MDKPLVSVIILNFNGREFLEGCLRSVLAQQYSPFEVLVIDNNSRDGSAEYVGQAFPGVRVIRSDRNLGFAGGNNLGVTHAKGEYIILLNNDTTVGRDWLSALTGAMKQNDVAVASSFARTDGIPERYYERNGSINLIGHNIMRVFDDPREVLYAGGTSMIFRKSVIGLPFDDSYFAYSEDVYCSLRAWFMGYRVVQVPESVVDHAGGGTSKKTPNSGLTMMQERNRLLTIGLFFSWWTLFRITPFLLANCTAKLLYSALHPRYSFPGIVRAYLWLALHPVWVLRKRRILRREFVRPEKEILALMTARLTNGESFAGRFVNLASVLYCRITGLRTIEIVRGKS